MYKEDWKSIRERIEREIEISRKTIELNEVILKVIKKKEKEAKPDPRIKEIKLKQGKAKIKMVG